MKFLKTILKLIDKLTINIGFTKNKTQTSTNSPPVAQPINIHITNTVDSSQNRKKVAAIYFVQEPEDAISKEKLKTVIVEAKDETGLPIANALINIKVNKENIVLYGKLAKFTDSTGCAKYDDLMINKSGNYRLQASYEYLQIYSESFHVYPPCSDIDFQKYPSGSTEEVNSFITAALEKKNPKDKIKYNGEEY